MKYKKYKIVVNDNLKLLVFDSRKNNNCNVPCFIWIHGGGYIRGNYKRIYISSIFKLLKMREVIIISPNYRLSSVSSYPAALEDCYLTLQYVKDNASNIGIDSNKIIIGGESAGGGLAIATLIYAKSKNDNSIKYMFPLYPMIDCYDTPSSFDNHGLVWNTRKNHVAWKKYLNDLYNSKDIPVTASPSRLDDYSILVPFYTFVGDGETFYSEVVSFCDKAKKSSVDCSLDIYHTKVHAFDTILFWSRKSRIAKKRLLDKCCFVIDNIK